MGADRQIATFSDLGPGFTTLNRLTPGKLQIAYQPGGDFMAAFPGPGGSTPLLIRPAGTTGIVNMIQFSMSAGNLSFDGQLRIFVDQESTPSFVADFGTLFVSHNDAHLNPGQIAATEHLNVGICGTNNGTGFSSGVNEVSYALKFPVPYGNGIRIEVYNPTGSGGGTTDTPIYSQVTYREGFQFGVPYRLRSASVSQLQAQTWAGTVDIPFFDLQNVSGWMVSMHLVVSASTGYNYLERPYQFFVDGESTPSYGADGGEDIWGGTGWYFVAMTRFNSPWGIVTCSNNANFTFNGFLDFLMMHGGVKFNNRIKGVWTNKQSYSSTTAKVAWCFLFYVNTMIPYPPSAPLNPIASASTPTSVLVSWTAPASPGSQPITGYTVTSTPGNMTATAGSGAVSVVVPGLSTGTAYAFTVAATNPVGTGAASAPSNAITPSGATVPGAPTIGTATAGSNQAVITFTAPASNGGSTITGYTATSTPGNITASVSGATATPITVTGLTNGVAYTFTVHATNGAGNSPESAASNSVTPSLGSSVSDQFNRTDGTTLGVADTGQTWQYYSGGGWGIRGGAAYTINSLAGLNLAYIDSGKHDGTLTFVYKKAGSNCGPLFRMTDASNNIYIYNGGIGGWQAGSFVSLGTWSSAFQDGDTCIVILSGTSITVQQVRAGVTTTLGTYTSSFNQTATLVGMQTYNDTVAEIDSISFN